MPTTHQTDPSRVQLVLDRLDDQGQLQLEVRTTDLGRDHPPAVHVYDDAGHIDDVWLTFKDSLPNNGALFRGEIAIEALKRRGFDVSKLEQKPFVAVGSKIIWGDSQSYDAKRYRAPVDDHVWRGSSINDAADLRELMEQQRPKLIITLRELHERKYNDDERLVAEWNHGRPRDERVKLERIEMRDFHPPTIEQVIRFLDLVTDPDHQPAYVHCRAGIGRTGTMIAAYRMAVGRRSLDDALAEAKELGLADPQQIDFLRDFAAKLAAGQIPGYP